MMNHARAAAALFASCVLVLSFCVPACAAEPPPADRAPKGPDLSRPYRAVWVTRMDYRTAADVRRIVDDVASVGFTDLIWQVRGQADAFYESSLEPWGQELLRDLPAGAKGPGFDPLAVAVDRAHERGLLIHAWLNMMPLWKGTTPPKDPRHPYHAHPQWRLYDQSGKPQALHDHYVIVNPVRTDVQDHLVAVCTDIVTRYRVDGLHMDYIRFVSEKMDDKSVYPADPESLGEFRDATGRDSIATPEGRAAFQDWKRSGITDLVRRIRKEALAGRPEVEFSAAVWRRPDLARDTYLQDAAAWINEGTLDRAVPMIYTDKNEQFDSDLAAWLAAVPKGCLSVGVGAYLHGPTQTGVQLESAKKTGRVRGFSIFAYSSMFESADPSQPKDDKTATDRRLRRQAISALIKEQIESARGGTGAGGRR